MDDRQNVFSGLKVVDLASFIAGPASATILSDFGATVIKVEPPGIGDPYRRFSMTPPNPVSSHNYAWQLTNRNKRSLCIDLKNPRSKEILEALVKWADVLVTNFPPKVKSSLGLAYDQISGLNPRLVYADITGYGSEGPEADKPGFDITAYWARTGLMHVSHDEGSPPTLPIPGIGDHATASTLYSAIVTGLYRREKTGLGSYVTTSLIAEGAWAAAAWIEGGLNGAKFFPQHNRLKPPNALLNPYQTSDGRWILFVAAQEKDWTGFCTAVGLQDLEHDERFASATLRGANAEALVSILDPVLAGATLAQWRERLDKARVIYGVVQNAEEILHDPQMHANGIFTPLAEPADGVTHTVNSPVQIRDVKKVPPGRAPALGEHTEAVLADLGFSEAKVRDLLAASAVMRGKAANS